MKNNRTAKYGITGRCGKLFYNSKNKAKGAMKKLSNLPSYQNKGVLNTYYCIACEGWHIGHHNWSKP